MTAPERLVTLRARMDDLNGRLVALLHERAGLAREIGRNKRDAGLPAIDPEREAGMLRDLTASSPDGGFDRAAIRQILDVVFEQSRALVADA